MAASRNSKIENEVTTPKLLVENDLSSIKDRLETLPPEIYNHIFDLTFTLLAGIHDITINYRPPSCLQINKSIRSKAMKSYYNESRFLVHGGIIFQWLRSLPVAYIGRVHEVLVFDGEAAGPRKCRIYSAPAGFGNSTPGVIANDGGRLSASDLKHYNKLQVQLGIQKEQMPPCIRRAVERVHACDDRRRAGESTL